MRRVKALKTDEDIKSLRTKIRACGERYELLFRLGLETGLRISDLLEFKYQTLLDIDTGYTTVRMRKTGRSVEICPSPVLMRDLFDFARKKRLRRSEYMFYSSDMARDRPLTRQHCWRVMRAIGAEIGRPSIGTHTMRKTYALYRYRKRRNIDELQTDLGHKYLSSTLCYLLDKDNMNNLNI